MDNEGTEGGGNCHRPKIKLKPSVLAHLSMGVLDVRKFPGEYQGDPEGPRNPEVTGESNFQHMMSLTLP